MRMTHVEQQPPNAAWRLPAPSRSGGFIGGGVQGTTWGLFKGVRLDVDRRRSPAAPRGRSTKSSCETGRSRLRYGRCCGSASEESISPQLDPPDRLGTRGIRSNGYRGARATMLTHSVHSPVATGAPSESVTRTEFADVPSVAGKPARRRGPCNPPRAVKAKGSVRCKVSRPSTWQCRHRTPNPADQRVSGAARQPTNAANRARVAWRCTDCTRSCQNLYHKRHLHTEQAIPGTDSDENERIPHNATR